MDNHLTPPVLVDEAAMTGLAARLAGFVEAPLVMFLHGDLGAGKTTFARALIQALGHQGRVKSPTYGLMERYPVKNMQVLHLDLYRIVDAGELEYLGIRDLLEADTILLVEWPQNGDGALPQPDISLELADAADKRQLSWRMHTRKGRNLVSKLTNSNT
jgi:tRNA threonylcarbamoyladenosine biosynthesis protein TsaE